MALMLTSRLNIYIKDENENKIAIILENTNEIATNIRKYSNKMQKLVFIANDPDDFENNNTREQTLFKTFELTFKNCFPEKIILDHRNSQDAKKICQNADLIILGGGKCLCQKKFFDEIGLKTILKNLDGLIIGISAGTMNLCNIVANFPEETADLEEPRNYNGLGFCDEIIIPHFNGELLTYDCYSDEIDVVNDYILPASYNKTLTGIPNGSYILIDNNGNKKYFGDIYRISKGKVNKIKN